MLASCIKYTELLIIQGMFKLMVTKLSSWAKCPGCRGTQGNFQLGLNVLRVSMPVVVAKMATAMFAETMDNTQHSTWLTPKSQSYTLNSRHENLMTRIQLSSFSHVIC
jgi:hypothetical protein